MLAWVMLLSLGFLWGASFILIKKALLVFSPYQLAALRVSLSALAFVPYVIYRFKHLKWKKYLPYIIITGITGNLLPAFLFSLAQTEISSSLASIFNALTPLFTLIVGVLIFRIPFISKQLAGVLLGLIGAVLIILLGNRIGLEGNLWYALFAIAGTVCYGTSVNTVKSYLQNLKSIEISAASLCSVGVPAIFILFANDITGTMQTHPDAWEGFMYVAFLALISTSLATVIFYKIVEMTDAVFSSMVSYLIPGFALIWGWWDGELISLLHYIGLGLIFFGVYLAGHKKKF